MKRLAILFSVLLFGCSPVTHSGMSFKGADGHSIIPLTPGTLPGVCSNGGSSVDLYLDLDNTLSVTEGDLYQSTVFACNGIDGAVGPAGPSGTMTATIFPNDTTCRSVGGGFFAKKSSSTSDRIRFYTTAACSGTYVRELRPCCDEAFWPSSITGFFMDGTSGAYVIYRLAL